MRIIDWSSDVCSSDLGIEGLALIAIGEGHALHLDAPAGRLQGHSPQPLDDLRHPPLKQHEILQLVHRLLQIAHMGSDLAQIAVDHEVAGHHEGRSEEHTSELQSLMRNSYAVFCLKTKKTKHNTN